MANGLPPKVEPCEPGPIQAATFLVIKQAPIGKPPPIPLAMGAISGLMPACSKANNFPVLPIPH